MGIERKKAIYNICVEYGMSLASFVLLNLAQLNCNTDVIICEDDPYYFLQQGLYKPKSERNTATIKHDSEKFFSHLAPSYLKVDYQGRVVRLDTFSKVSFRLASCHLCRHLSKRNRLSLLVRDLGGSRVAL